MKNYLLLLSVTVLIVLAACSSEVRRPKTNPEEGNTPGTTTGVVSAVPIDPGDIETNVFLEALVDEKAVPANVKVEKIESAKKHLSLETVTVNAPFPIQIPMIFRVVSDKAFPETPVVLHIKVFRDKEEVKSFNTLILHESTTMLAPHKPIEFPVNILEGISAPPDTMLIKIQAEVILLKKGTPRNAINPDTVQSTDGQVGNLLGNPVRINFVQSGTGS